MEKVMIGKMPAAAMPVVIVGALVKGKANYVTLAGFGMVDIQPPTVFIKSAKSHYTNDGIRETGYFSVNVPSAGQIRETDYVGLVSGHDTDKSGVFTPFYGSMDKAPMARECPVNILCKVIHTVNLPTLHQSRATQEIFIGEIVEVHASKDYTTDGKPDMSKIRPLLWTGSHYFEMGNKPLGVAWSEGKALIKKEAAYK